MKKILSIFVILIMALVSAQAVMADEQQPTYCTPHPPDDGCAWKENLSECVSTTVTIAGGTGSGTGGTGTVPGNDKPIIKCKWEYDLDFSVNINECDIPCPQCAEHPDGKWIHDACCQLDGLQVKPRLGKTVKVGYFAIVNDPNGVSTVEEVYADVWHPDGEFKYQVEMHPVDEATAKYEWNHVKDCHFDLITFNQDWITANGGEGFDYLWDIYDEIDEGLAKLYYGEAPISYCQPGGFYTVGVRACDYFNDWSDFLWNQFWYIPTSAIDIDFNSIDYGTVIIDREQKVGGDTTFVQDDNKPTVRNIGNTPVTIYVWQDDMNFGDTYNYQTNSYEWNVEYDAQLTSNENNNVRYDPYENKDIGRKGVPLKPTLKLCTQEKIDFSIHVNKAINGETYTGTLCLFAWRAGNPTWETPIQFIRSEVGLPQDLYPTDPGPYGPGEPVSP